MSLGIINWVKCGVAGLALMGVCSSLAYAEANTAQTSQESYAQALRGQTLRIGVTLAPPFAYITDSMSNLHGIDVDIIHELQKRTGFSLDGDRIVVMNFDEMMNAGRNGRLDVLGGGITLSESRNKIFDFSEPYMKSALVLVTRRNDTIRGIEDLNGRRLAAENGSTASDVLPEAKNLNVEVETTPTAFMSMFDVYSNDADAVVIDQPMVEFYINNWGSSNLEIIDQVSDPEHLGLLFKKNAQISRPLQEAYHAMIEDGTIQRIVEKHTESHIAKN